jgi:hypothetical protein
VRASYAAAGESALRYASGRASSSAFSMAERRSSGDRFYEKAGLGQQDLGQQDLGQQDPAPADSQTNIASPPPQPKHKAVDDFSL